MRIEEISKGVWSEESESRYVVARIERAHPGNQDVLRQYAEWLKESGGLSAGSVTVRIGSAATFLDRVSRDGSANGVEMLSSLTSRHVEDYFVTYVQEQGKGASRSMQSTLRLLLRFAEAKGWTSSQLWESVPRLRSYRLSSVPRAISDEALRELVESEWDGCRCPRRDRALIELLSVYGVRRGQVSALKLTDIDWSARTIRFAAHKAGQELNHPLVDTCALSLSSYLCEERSASDSEYVFLRFRSPYTRLSPRAITLAVRARMLNCGLKPLSPHAFRHAFASRLLNQGQSVKTIADFLGHRSLHSVGIYAKLDHPRLREAAVAWPEVLS